MGFGAKRNAQRQDNAGPIETSSDGVVSYASELVVRSGRGLCANPDAQREVLRSCDWNFTTARPLHNDRPASSAMIAGYAEARNKVFSKDVVPSGSCLHDS